ncbi:MAG: cadherin-like domain-containing protein [Alphaproteobacteria bacterium]
MADGITPFAPTPVVRSSFAGGTQKIAPSVLDLGSYYLTRNARAESLARVFARPSSGDVFANVEGFLAAATSADQNFSTAQGSAAAKNSANAAYAAALELLGKRETPAEKHLRELLKAATPKLVPPAAAPATLKLEANEVGELEESSFLTITSSQLSATADKAVNNNITYNVTGGPVNGHLELAGNPGAGLVSFTQAQVNAGLVRYVHNGTDTASDRFSFTVTAGTESLKGTFRLAITPTNDAPDLVTNTGAALDEGDSTVLTTAQLNATDVDTLDSNLVYSVTSGPAHGRLELTTDPGTEITSFTQSELAAGRVRYVNDASEFASDSFTFALSDETTTLSPATFNFTINPVDDAPELTNTGASLIEGDTLTLDTAALGATDADTGDSNLVFTVTSAPVNGYLQLSTDPGTAITSFTQADLALGIVQYVHDGSETTADSFGFSLTDGETTINDTFNITVAPEDDAPQLENNGLTVTEGSSAILTTASLNAADPDTADEDLVYSLTSLPVNGYFELTTNAGVSITSFTRADLAAGIVNYVHDGSEAATDSFTFTLADKTTTLAEETFNITINPVDDPPQITNNGAAVAEGSTTALTTAGLNTADVDTQDSALVYNVTSSPANGRLELATNPGVAITTFTQADLAAGIVNYVHNGSEAASDSFTFSLTDGTTTLAGNTVSITVTPVDDSPVLTTNSGATVTEGSSALITSAELNATDGDTADADLVYTITSAPVNGYVELTTNAGIAITSFTQADLAAGVVNYVHDGSEATSDAFAFTLSDGTTTLAADAFNITVSPIDDAPELTNTGATVAEGNTVTLSPANLGATDADTGDSDLVFTLTSPPANGYLQFSTDPGTSIATFTQADIAAGLVQYVHGGGENTSDSFTFTLNDGTTTLGGTFNVTVTPVDDVPVLATNTGVTTVEGSSAILTTARLSASDADTANANLTFAVTSSPANGYLELTTNPGVSITSFTQADLAAGIVNYVHNGSEAASDSFTFTLSDGTTTLAAATFNITVAPTDDAPVLDTNVAATLNEGATVAVTTANLNVTDVDTANFNLTYTLTSNPANGYLQYNTSPGTAITSFTQADLEAGLVEYVHNGSETTSDSFTFIVSDLTTTLSAATFGINVNPVNDAPVITNNGASVTEGSSTIITTAKLTASDPDTANVNLVYTVNTAPAHGRLELTTDPGVSITSFTQTDLAAGRVRYVHDASEPAADSFTFTLSDGTNTLSGNTFNITVNPVDDPPVLTTNLGTVVSRLVGSTVITSLQLSASDPDTATSNITFNVTTAPSKGYLELTTNPGTAITSFTQADIDAGRVRYVHTSGGLSADSFAFTVSDATTTLAAATFNITVIP